VANTEDNRRAYRELLLSTPGLGQYISGSILFEETLFQARVTQRAARAFQGPAAAAVEWSGVDTL
jgi:fructose-bisphosphate aldolase class 1